MSENKGIVLESSAYQAVFSEDNGCIRHIVDKATNKRVCRGNLDAALWKLYFRDRTSIMSSQFVADLEDRRFSYTLSGKELTLRYESADVTVAVVFTASGRYLDSRVTISNPREVVLTLNYPQKVTFDVDRLNRLHFPHDLGVAFKKPFYTAGHNTQSFSQGTYSSGYGDVHTQGGRYPDLFSDFMFLDSKDGTLSIYGIQPEASVFVPCTLCTAADPGRRGVPYYDHSFNTYVTPDEAWSSPVLRIEVSTTLKAAIQSYCEANEFKRTLKEKMTPALYEKFRKSVLLHYRSRKLPRGQHFTFKKDTEVLDKFAEFAPIQMHISDFMLGNFDKQYPDMFPPNPVKGTMDELQRFYARAHELGMIVCPYDNPTWWCEAPPAPSLEEHGDVVLARDLDGDVVREYYFGNEGFALSFAHPILKEIRRRNIQLFTQDVLSDIVFQDQVGARRWIYDTNPAAGVPYGYTQGIIDIAKEDCKIAPLSTEDGFDRLINHEIEFCGLTWYLDPGVRTLRRQGYSQIFKDFQNTPTLRCVGDKWELSPISLMMAHDKVAFTHHDLGQTIDTKEQLSASLAIGYMMIYRRGPDIEEDELKWLRWLDLIQKRVCARYIDKKLSDFEHLEQGITRSTFEDIVIVANWTEQDYAVSPGYVIAPKGFYVTSTTDDLVAGVFTEFNGISYTEEIYMLKDGEDIWVSPAGESPINIPT